LNSDGISECDQQEWMKYETLFRWVQLNCVSDGICHWVVLFLTVVMNWCPAVFSVFISHCMSLYTCHKSSVKRLCRWLNVQVVVSDDLCCGQWRSSLSVWHAAAKAACLPR